MIVSVTHESPFFWQLLEIAYHDVCREMAIDPDAVDLEVFSEGLDQLAQEYGQ